MISSSGVRCTLGSCGGDFGSLREGERVRARVVGVGSGGAREETCEPR